MESHTRALLLCPRCPFHHSVPKGNVGQNFQLFSLWTYMLSWAIACHVLVKRTTHLQIVGTRSECNLLPVELASSCSFDLLSEPFSHSLRKTFAILTSLTFHV
jgi:hypothetical protein